ncbi:uncharacterized protein [Fopius arisanus]|uniref:Uncharacterized protein n=1 Tax=Fopius arisanus TaxID=64838 RepID=A0A9R1U2C1_9HYME|nr:PREDICTED: uncharacterized protein LOC105267441 [Fopius arisanus]
MFIKNIRITTSIIIQLFCLTTSEWIDIPEFSDTSRIYRLPFNKHERNKLTDGQIGFANFYNAKVTTENPFLEIMTTDRVMEPQLMIDRNDFTTPVNGDEDGVVTDGSDADGSDEEMPKAPGVTDRGDVLYYLPMELFNQVHKTLLQNKHSSIKEKIDFLKNFKQSLLKNIESRLDGIVNSPRVKRGSEWEDDHVGFPSLEGALLAISFLTFSVYLVQLVMMLFRNLANNPPAINTILVNRNKRSADITDETARILNYLEEFSRNKLKN